MTRHNLAVVATACLWLALLAAGCATYEQRQEAVVTRSRAYALRLFPELTEVQRHHVNFTKPRILQRRVLVREGPKYESDRDIMHSCVVWELPESDGQSLMVVGVGERKFQEWRPLRALIRQLGEAEEEFVEAP